ncbi:MAG: Ig-like domain repeat protein, partial [Acidobacteriota bacterium]|nr:Ig-like domain repeat protein [Acidobacteriota bacterium]
MFFICVSAFAQTANRMTLAGHMRPEAAAANDRGRVAASMTLHEMSIFFRPAASQKADLETLLREQQDPASPNYHKWLTPEQYAARFGVSDEAANKVTSWLTAQGFTDITMARGRGSVSFSGNVRAVERAFGTQIHNYLVNGETHYANASEPSMPVEIAGSVLAVHGMTDFRMRPHTKMKTRYTWGASGAIFVSPDDLATIYDVKPLLDSGINGTKQTIVVVGQTNINLDDIRTFRAYFNLPASDPILTLVPTSKDPGIVSDDETEADLDIELAGAMARNATINFVYSNDVEVSANYAINQNLAPVVSMSYGLCETASGNADLMSLQALAQQGNAQGITWIAASGDNGAADCYQSGLRGNVNGNLAVDAPASIPEVTGVGGTEFNEGAGTFWAVSNDRNQSSALSYIPEVVWNDSVIDGVPSSSGGGASNFFTTKPAWQTGPGVPNDSARDVPDISLASSADHDPILIYSGGSFGLVGGTSCAAPAFAGMTALLNQYVVTTGLQSSAGLGNMNPRLYGLASTGGVFHDITTGDNIVNGCTGVRNCTVSSVGYSAGPGYDQATGLGSVDAFNLVTAWHQTAATTSKLQSAVTVTAQTTTVPATNTVQLTVTVTGGGTPTGTVTFTSGGATLGTQTLSAKTATLTFAASKLAVGFNSISAAYSGDSNFAPSAGSTTVNVNTTTAISIQGLVNAASYRQGYAPGEIVA